MKRYLSFTLFAIVVVMLVSCQKTNSVKVGLPNTTPEKVGLSSKRLTRIDKVIQQFVDEGKLAGAVTLVARRGKVAHLGTYGMADIESQKPMQANSIFRIASMSKPIVSVAAMTLYEEGHFQLDDPVSKFIPEFKGLKVHGVDTGDNEQSGQSAREMTIQDLLRHTAGLAYGGGGTYVDSIYREVKVFDDRETLQEMVQKLGRIPLLYQPGERWHYSVATDVLGYLIQVISAKPLDEFLKERIFDTLGMEDTGFYVPEEKLERFAPLYGMSEQGVLHIREIPDTSKYSRKPSFLSGGGGLVSTVPDYMRFAQMLLNKGELGGSRILSPKTVELMTMNHVPANAMPLKIGAPAYEFLVKGGFGLGFRVLLDVADSSRPGSIGTYGWAGAYDTSFWIDPEEEMIGIIMSQFRAPPPYPAVKEFQVLMYQSIVD